jgi:endogenous inhibitor of DNA gyrase (YacG/DUF329 family)
VNCPKCGKPYTNSDEIPSGKIYYHACPECGEPAWDVEKIHGGAIYHHRGKRCICKVRGKVRL